MSLAQTIAAKRAERERIVIEVEEWGEGGEPLRLYSAPISARDMEQVGRKHKNFLAEQSLSGIVDMLILKLEDVDGKKALTLEDKPVLMGEGPVTLMKVFSQIFAVSSIEDHEKN